MLRQMTANLETTRAAVVDDKGLACLKVLANAPKPMHLVEIAGLIGGIIGADEAMQTLVSLRFCFLCEVDRKPFADKEKVYVLTLAGLNYLRDCEK